MAHGSKAWRASRTIPLFVFIVVLGTTAQVILPRDKMTCAVVPSTTMKTKNGIVREARHALLPWAIVLLLFSSDCYVISRSGAKYNTLISCSSNNVRAAPQEA